MGGRPLQLHPKAHVTSPQLPLVTAASCSKGFLSSLAFQRNLQHQLICFMQDAAAAAGRELRPSVGPGSNSTQRRAFAKKCVKINTRKKNETRIIPLLGVLT